MRLSTVLLVCAWILCCTGGADAVCRRFGAAAGNVFAASILLAALSAFEWTPFDWILVSPAPLLLAAWSLTRLCGRGRGAAIALSAGCALLSCLLCAAFPNAEEPGLLMALPIAAICRLFLPDRRIALAAVMLAAFLTAIPETLADWVLLGIGRLRLGSTQILDAQLAGTFLLAALSYLPIPDLFRRRCVDAHKT